MSAIAELSLDASQFVAGLTAATGSVQQFKNVVGDSESINKFRVATVTAALAVTAAAVAFVQGVKSAISLGATLQETSYKMGLTIRQTMALGEALRMVGGKSDDAQMMVTSMQGVIKSAGDTSSEAAQMLGKLGLSADALSKMSSAKQIDTITAAIAQMKNGIEKTQTAVSVFGANGERMVAALNPTTLGGANKALGDQVYVLERAAGMFARITTIMGLSGSTLMDVVSLAKTKLQGFFVGVAAGFAPEILAMIDGPKKAVREIVEDFGKMYPALAPVVDVVKSLVDLDLAGAGFKIGAAFGTVAEALKSGNLVAALSTYVSELKTNLIDSALAFVDAMKFGLSGLVDVFVGQLKVKIANVAAAMRAESVVYRNLISDESVGKMTREGLLQEQRGQQRMAQFVPTLKPVELPSMASMTTALGGGEKSYQQMIAQAVIANPTETNIRQEPVVPVMEKFVSESQKQTALLLKMADLRQQNMVLR